MNMKYKNYIKEFFIFIMLSPIINIYFFHYYLIFRLRKTKEGFAVRR